MKSTDAYNLRLRSAMQAGLEENLNESLTFWFRTDMHLSNKRNLNNSVFWDGQFYLFVIQSMAIDVFWLLKKDVIRPRNFLLLPARVLAEVFIFFKKILVGV